LPLVGACRWFAFSVLAAANSATARATSRSSAHTHKRLPSLLPGSPEMQLTTSLLVA
jgi:hypothetical protein